MLTETSDSAMMLTLGLMMMRSTLTPVTELRRFTFLSGPLPKSKHLYIERLNLFMKLVLNAP
jgi:hypothetical protein